MGQSDVEKAYQVFASQIPRLLADYPMLYILDKGGEQVVAGKIEIVDKEGKYWDSYDIEIHCSAFFPFRYPDLYETGGKIPKMADWHIYEDTLTCCVNVLPEEAIRCNQGITLTEYVTEEVIPYFFNQTHRRVEGYYVNGEYRHGKVGIYDYYVSLLKTTSPIVMSKLLYAIAGLPKPNRTSDCFCGSGSKYRYCHRAAYEKLSLMGRNLLLEHANFFIKIANN